MQRIWDWLLNLQQVRLTKGDVSLRLTAPWPAWVALLATVAAVVFVIWIYRRDGGTRTAKIVGGTLRALLLILLLLMIWQPVIHVDHVGRESGIVAVLIDTSGSMSTPDVYGPDDPMVKALAAAADSETNQVATDLTGQQRLELIRRFLSDEDYKVCRKLLEKNDLVLYGFTRGASRQAILHQDEAEPGDEQEQAKAKAVREAQLGKIQDLKADGLATSLGDGLSQVLSELRGQRVAAVIVLSDGRSTLESNLDAAIEQAHAFRNPVPVHTVRVGSIQPPRDLAVSRVVAEPVVFVKDLVAVKAIVRQHGYEQPEQVVVKLIDQKSQKELSSSAVTVGQPDEDGQIQREVEAELRWQPEEADTYQLVVRVEPTGGADMNPRNNASVTQLEVKDAKIRVLYIEGYPRWEYRYLKNSLKNEKTVILSVYLFSADEHFAQEGNKPIARLPASPEEWKDYDVIIIGDCDPLVDLGLAQMEAVETFVREWGGGFAMIAGERSAPQRYTNTPLARLLPIEIDPTAGPDRVNRISGFKIRPTYDGKRSPILRFERLPERNDSTIAAFPELYWYKRVLGRKHVGITLAEHPTAIMPNGEPVPLLVAGRYGAGKTYFSAVDSTWRWRWHTGVGFFDAYWVNLVRWLSRNKLLETDRRFELSTSQTEYDLGQRVEVILELLDRSFERVPDEIPVSVTDYMNREIAVLRLQRAGRDAWKYSATFIPPAEGDYAFSLDRNTVAATFGLAERDQNISMPRTQINVKQASQETEQLAIDRDALERLAGRTNGRAITLAGLDELAAEIPDMGRPLEDPTSHPLWDTKLALILFALILTIEWIWRKRYNLQ